MTHSMKLRIEVEINVDVELHVEHYDMIGKSGAIDPSRPDIVTVVGVDFDEDELANEFELRALDKLDDLDWIDILY